jgi:hypothetical protein
MPALYYIGVLGIRVCPHTPAFDWKRHIEIAPFHLARAAWLALPGLLPATAVKAEKASLGRFALARSAAPLRIDGEQSVFAGLLSIRERIGELT